MSVPLHAAADLCASQQVQHVGDSSTAVNYVRLQKVWHGSMVDCKYLLSSNK